MRTGLLLRYASSDLPPFVKKATIGPFQQVLKQLFRRHVYDASSRLGRTTLPGRLVIAVLASLAAVLVTPPLSAAAAPPTSDGTVVGGMAHAAGSDEQLVAGLRWSSRASGLRVLPSRSPFARRPAPFRMTPSRPPSGSSFPSVVSTGARVALSSMTRSGGITSSYDGQVIERKDITGNVKILHDNVVVRDSRISFTSTYGLRVDRKADGSCPVGTLFEHVEVDGRLADEAHVPVYAPGCAWTLDHAHVHDVGRSIRLTNNNVVSNSYVVSSRTGDSGSHRGAAGTNGGRNNKLINNVLVCSGAGCSAAIPMYGDFSPVDGMLVQHNLLATTGSYCAYGGSLKSKPYPHGSNVKFIDNHFSTGVMHKCGRYGAVAGFANNVRGNEARGNVWHETGLPVSIG